jgi:hypothetical protein
MVDIMTFSKNQYDTQINRVRDILRIVDIELEKNKYFLEELVINSE